MLAARQGTPTVAYSPSVPELCPDCGSDIPTGGPFGELCPQCLLGLGLADVAVTAESRVDRADESPVSAILTLPTGALRTPVTMTVGAPAEISTETESLFRGRLQVGAWMILLAVTGFLVKELIVPPDSAPNFRASFGTPAFLRNVWDSFGGRAFLLMFYVAVIVLLRGRRRLSLGQLRVVEAAILWAVALWFMIDDRVRYTREAIEQQDPVETLWAVALAVMIYFALLSAYGFFAPNAWKRALWMTGLIALMPMAVSVLVGATDSEAAFLMESVTMTHRVGMGLTLAIGVMIATWGAHRIHTLRLEVFEAKRLGQYELTERIGRGGMGEVWKADHRLLARPAAIKLIKPEVIDADPAMAQDFIRSFEREAQITASLRSIHTVELYDFGMTADSTFYYVMELLDGKDLETLVRESGPLEPSRVTYLLEQVCDSLADAHDHGLVHRDIKPANIQVCRMGRRFDFVKVLDFGLVKRRTRRGETRGLGEGKGVIVGTPSYIAPEMVLAEDIDARADIYSLGCVGYWLLTGQPVFEGKTTAEIVAKHVQEAVVAPAQRAETEIPEELEGIILRCLEKEPAARPQSAEELSQLLRASGLVDEWTQDRARVWWEEAARD